MSSPSSPRTGRHTLHVSRACNSCRGRYKCNGLEPCGMCAARHSECKYSLRVDKRRALTRLELDAVNDRIAALEQENEQLKAANAQLTANLADAAKASALTLTITDTSTYRSPASPFPSTPGSSDGSWTPYWPSPQPSMASLPGDDTSPALPIPRPHWDAALFGRAMDDVGPYLPVGPTIRRKSAPNLPPMDGASSLRIPVPIAPFNDGGVDTTTAMLDDMLLSPQMMNRSGSSGALGKAEEMIGYIDPSYLQRGGHVFGPSSY